MAIHDSIQRWDQIQDFLPHSVGYGEKSVKITLNLLIQEIAESLGSCHVKPVEITCDLAEMLWPIEGRCVELRSALTALCLLCLNESSGDRRLALTTRNVEAQEAINQDLMLDYRKYVCVAISTAAPKPLLLPENTVMMFQTDTRNLFEMAEALVAQHHGLLMRDPNLGHGFQLFLPVLHHYAKS